MLAPLRFRSFSPFSPEVKGTNLPCMYAHFEKLLFWNTFIKIVALFPFFSYRYWVYAESDELKKIKDNDKIEWHDIKWWQLWSVSDSLELGSSILPMFLLDLYCPEAQWTPHFEGLEGMSYNEALDSLCLMPTVRDKARQDLKIDRHSRPSEGSQHHIWKPRY